MKELCSKWARFLVGMVREKAHPAGADVVEASASRSLAVWCAFIGSALAGGTIAFAFIHPAEAATTAALMGGVAMFIGGGAVALATKLKGPSDG